MSPLRRIDVEVVLDEGDELGEGPCWDALAGELLRVDIVAKKVHRWHPESGERWSITLDGEVGAVLPTAGGELLLAIERELVLRDIDGAHRTVATVDAPADHRFNDCRCDARGRVWAGTMSRNAIRGTAGLHRLERDGSLKQVVAGTTISNGIGWSPAGDRMYFIDSPTFRIDVFDVDEDSGAIAQRRTLVATDSADGKPDGLAVDAEGGLWVCFFGGGAIRRYAPDGSLDAVVPLPVTNPTCPAFGGRDLDALYVTSARYGLSAAQLAREPLAGAVLALDPGVRGLPGGRCIV